VKGFVRPDVVVLGEGAIVPSANLISPPPNQFTHEVTREQPYYYGGGEEGKAADGVLAAGARVVLLVYGGGAWCRVADARGLYVETAHAGLRAL
jgi:hypothetical protein